MCQSIAVSMPCLNSGVSKQRDKNQLSHRCDKESRRHVLQVAFKYCEGVQKVPLYTCTGKCLLGELYFFFSRLLQNSVGRGTTDSPLMADGGTRYWTLEVYFTILCTFVYIK